MPKPARRYVLFSPFPGQPFMPPLHLLGFICMVRIRQAVLMRSVNLGRRPALAGAAVTSAVALGTAAALGLYVP